MSITLKIVLIVLISVSSFLIIYIRNKFKRGRINPNVGKISFKESMDLVDLPVITFHNGDSKFNFLLDTGANISIISQNCLDSFKHENTNKVGELFGVEGNKQSLRFVKAVLRYKDVEYPEEFQVADLAQAFTNVKQEYGVTLHGVIGNSFFQKYKYVLDFSELVAYSIV